MYTRTDFNTTGSPQVHTSTIFTVALSGWNNTEVEIVFSWHTIERTNKQHPTESCKMETKLRKKLGSWSNFRNATRYFWILKPKNISFQIYVKRKPWSNKLPERRPFEIKKNQKTVYI